MKSKRITNIVDILLLWRTKEIAFAAEIEKMYQQIKMNEENQEYHRILWRFSDQEYRKRKNLAFLLEMLMGSVPSHPCCTVFTARYGADAVSYICLIRKSP